MKRALPCRSRRSFHRVPHSSASSVRFASATSEGRMAARTIAGLTVSSIDPKQIAPALGQADAIFASACAHLIASSQRFFVNLPFPLSGVREAGMPVYSWHDDRFAALAEVIRIAAAQFGVTDDLDRANVIVREYKPGQRIPLHIDDELCGPRVFGIILANGSPAHGELRDL